MKLTTLKMLHDHRIYFQEMQYTASIVFVKLYIFTLTIYKTKQENSHYLLDMINKS